MMMPAGDLPETDSTYESDEDAEENKTMKRVIGERSSRPTEPGRLTVPSGSAAEGESIMKNDETVRA